MWLTGERWWQGHGVGRFDSPGAPGPPLTPAPPNFEAGDVFTAFALLVSKVEVRG